jgi:hypothetical protein
MRNTLVLDVTPYSLVEEDRADSIFMVGSSPEDGGGTVCSLVYVCSVSEFY